ncbi:uroporphyrinogen decarboxylase [Hyphomonas johnsonii]|uniref:Uroporphyrinogen decarboxylase n=1 Tax=Hyphomonas johnsonii MHS-2 TaxID=1280950 RepID=A0A059FM56_9PROT|nr:uroporphyrinogen decarboxylase [Hyphomonas johnsonii]KCZ91770.1 uroporphyrinogen decarboxylase [Hyphomonas johnsonii MHS-2]
MGQTSTSKLISVLSGTPAKTPPVWMMRQAGRHLPEYLELRARAKDFLDFCYTPSMASEATLQPVRRYDMDAAILFADILLVLDAMGLKVEFQKGVGPLVQQISSAADLGKVPARLAADRLAPVYETVSRVREALAPDKALIGFAGSPWTVSLYAIEGRGKTDKSLAWRWAHGRPEELQSVMDHVIEATAHYLARQVEAGADVLMLFDSWAEGLPDNIFREVIIAPTTRLVSLIREMGVTVPIIGFPRGAGVMLGEYARETGVSAVGLDTAAVPGFVNTSLPENLPVQGHLDPLLLIEGGGRMDARIRELVAAYSGRPHIFNLGHGVRPDTPIANVERALNILREG